VQGFTLIEIIIVVAIMALLMSAFVFRYRDYNQVVLVDQLANEIALTLREGQFYATGVRERAPGTDDFSGWYGIFFEDDSQSYLSFADLDQNFEYDESEDEEIALYDTNGRIYLFGYLTYLSGEVPTPVDNAHIVFEKGHLNPYFKIPGTNFNRLMITVLSPDLSLERAVCIENTGRMYITRTANCPSPSE